MFTVHCVHYSRCFSLLIWICMILMSYNIFSEIRISRVSPHEILVLIRPSRRILGTAWGKMSSFSFALTVSCVWGIHYRRSWVAGNWISDHLLVNPGGNHDCGWSVIRDNGECSNRVSRSRQRNGMIKYCGMKYAYRHNILVGCLRVTGKLCWRDQIIIILANSNMTSDYIFLNLII